MKATCLSLSLSFPFSFLRFCLRYQATRRSLITLVIIKIKTERNNKTDDNDDRPPWFAMMAMMMIVIIVIITALVIVAIIFIISKQMVISRIFVAVARAFTGCSLIKKLGIVVRDVCMHVRAVITVNVKEQALHLFLFVRVFQRFY